jgi:uncharacterized membrane protein YdjX (TVP38/TMEM64 family)
MRIIRGSVGMKKIYKLLVVVGILVALYLVVSHYLTLECLQSKAESFRGLVDRKYLLSVGTYIVAMIIVVTTSIPLSVPLALIGGFLFGMWLGTLYTSIGIIAGAFIAFVLFRYVFRSLLFRYFGDRIERLERQVKVYGSSYLLVMHYSTVVPFFIINAVAALSGVSLKMFLVYTMVGSLPLNVLYSFAGGQFGSIKSVGDIFSPPVIAALVLLMLLAIMPIVIRRFKAQWRQ